MTVAMSEQQAFEHAQAGLAAVGRAQARIDELVADLDERDAHGASLLPGWTRGHVLSHLARNADGLVNLMTWARTGIEHPMYASAADRDADIEEGSRRLLQIIKEDVSAAAGRFTAAAEDMSPSAWVNVVSARGGITLYAATIPWLRLSELLIHAVDLDHGVDFDEFLGVADDEIDVLLSLVAGRYVNRDGVPPVRLDITLPTGALRTITIGTSANGDGVPQLSGPVPAALAWLTGRDNGAGLTGAVPELPTWL